MHLNIITITLIMALSGCTLHVCGNSETAHLVGDGTIGEQQQNEDSAEAKADVKVPDPKPAGL